MRCHRADGFGAASFISKLGSRPAAASPLSVTPGTGFASGKDEAIASTPPCGLDK